jgi:hypothetical protein
MTMVLCVSTSSVSRACEMICGLWNSPELHTALFSHSCMRTSVRNLPAGVIIAKGVKAVSV